MPVDARNLYGAAYQSAKAAALREAAAPRKPPVPPATKAVTDLTPEEVAAKYPKRVAEMSQVEYNAAKALFIRGNRR